MATSGPDSLREKEEQKEVEQEHGKPGEDADSIGEHERYHQADSGCNAQVSGEDQGSSGQVPEDDGADSDTGQEETVTTEAEGQEKQPSKLEPVIPWPHQISEHDTGDQDTYDCTDDEPENIPPEDTEVVGGEIAPAQKNRINTGVAAESEAPEKALLTRKKHMEKMTVNQMADYMSRHLSTSVLKDRDLLAKWLGIKVEV